MTNSRTAPGEVEREILDLEQKYWKAIQEKDVEAALALTHEPCVVSGAQGIATLDRQAFERMMQASNFTLDAFQLSKPEVRLVTPDVAVVAYQVRESLFLDGRKLTLDAADTSTWVHRDGRWFCAAHTESLLGDPFGRDKDAN